MEQLTGLKIICRRLYKKLSKPISIDKTATVRTSQDFRWMLKIVRLVMMTPIEQPIPRRKVYFRFSLG